MLGNSTPSDVSKGFDAFDGWSMEWPHYSEDDTRELWEGFSKSPPTRITAGTLFHKADQAVPGWRDGKKGNNKERKQADRLIDLAAEADLFHTPDQTAYADVMINGHRETYRVESRAFNQWLRSRYLDITNFSPSRDALRQAIETLSARAIFKGPTRQVALRVGGHYGKIYLDLCDQEWRAVEVGPDDWRVVTDPPIRFRRSKGMEALPVPIKSKEIYLLRSFVNIPNDSDFVLLVSFLCAALRDKGPYVGLSLRGEPGSAKSTLARIVRLLVDPNKVKERRPPRQDQDLHIHAKNAHVLSFGNVSQLPDWLSDSLCSVMTGGGFATRQLYTDEEEALFDAQ